MVKHASIDSLCAAEVASQHLKPSMSVWMTDCFEAAAACRFEALSIACDRAVTGTTGQPGLRTNKQKLRAFGVIAGFPHLPVMLEPKNCYWCTCSTHARQLQSDKA